MFQQKGSTLYVFALLIGGLDLFVQYGKITNCMVFMLNNPIFSLTLFEWKGGKEKLFLKADAANLVKFRYCEKATKFEKNLQTLFEITY